MLICFLLSVFLVIDCVVADDDDDASVEDDSVIGHFNLASRAYGRNE